MQLSNTLSVAAVLKNSLRAEPEHFDRSLPRDEAIALFRRHVELIEVETTSYCNRTCSFCPNQFIDRRSEKNPMPEATWQAILHDLAAVDYDGTFVWSRYSEPLSEERIVERVREVRTAAPRARICINSNGDYLDAEYLQRLVDAGLDRLWIDIYLPDSDVFDLELAEKYHDRFLKRVQLTGTLVHSEPELMYRLAHPKIEITTHVRNNVTMSRTFVSDRGGLISIAKREQRAAPCYAPFKHLVIDNDGSIVVCCHLRSDSPTHRDAVVGRIGDPGVGLVEAYVALADWRKGVYGFGPKEGPCSGCNVMVYRSTPITRAISAALSPERAVTAPIRALARVAIRKAQRY